MQKKKRRRISARERKKQVRRILIIDGILLVILLVVAVMAVKAGRSNSESEKKEIRAEEIKGPDAVEVPGKEDEQDKTAGKKEKKPVSIVVSATGDCTLGTDEFFNYSDSFAAKYEEQGNPAYFFQNVKSIFEEDDLTIVNLEGTFSDSETREDKQFAFKADPAYAKILTEGGVEAANLANNHSKDYGEESYTDTIEALDAVDLVSFGYDRTAIMDVKGVKVGLLGTYVLRDGIAVKDSMIENIEALKKDGAQIIIASFHWGTEKSYEPDEVQIELAHAAIDNGADLVLGHHPHVLEGIEEYKGKNIVYSLGNFCFGGNTYPFDMNTIIFQQTFTVEGGELVEDNETNIIPCRISSVDEYNNFQPTPAEGEQKDYILNQMNDLNALVNK